jgi:hypothetical protein
MPAFEDHDRGAVTNSKRPQYFRSAPILESPLFEALKWR